MATLSFTDKYKICLYDDDDISQIQDKPEDLGIECFAESFCREMDALIGRNRLEKSRSLPAESYLNKSTFYKEYANLNTGRSNIGSSNVGSSNVGSSNTGNSNNGSSNDEILRDAGDLKIGNVVYDTKVKTCKFDQNIAIKKLSKRAEQHGVEESGRSDEEDCDSANGSIETRPCEDRTENFTTENRKPHPTIKQLKPVSSVRSSHNHPQQTLTFKRQKSKSSANTLCYTKSKLEARDSLNKNKKQDRKPKLVVKTSFSKSNAFLENTGDSHEDGVNNHSRSRDRTKKLCSNSKSKSLREHDFTSLQNNLQRNKSSVVLRKPKKSPEIYNSPRLLEARSSSCKLRRKSARTFERSQTAYSFKHSPINFNRQKSLDRFEATENLLPVRKRESQDIVDIPENRLSLQVLKISENNRGDEVQQKTFTKSLGAIPTAVKMVSSVGDLNNFSKSTQNIRFARYTPVSVPQNQRKHSSNSMKGLKCAISPKLSRHSPLMLEIADSLKNVKQGIGNLMKHTDKERKQSRSRTRPNPKSCVYDAFDAEETSLNSSKVDSSDHNTFSLKTSIFTRKTKTKGVEIPGGEIPGGEIPVPRRKTPSSLGYRSVSHFEQNSFEESPRYSISRNLSVDATKSSQTKAPRSTSSSNSSKFTEQSISSLKKRTRSKVQNFLSIRKTDKPPLKTEKPETPANHSHYHPHFHPHPHNHLPNYQQRFSIDEYQRDSSSGRGSDFSPCMSNDRVFFQTEKTNVEMEVYPDGLARIIDPRITELDFWRDAVLDAL